MLAQSLVMVAILGKWFSKISAIQHREKTNEERCCTRILAFIPPLGVEWLCQFHTAASL